MADEPTMTAQTLAMLNVMLDDPTQPWYGLEVAEASGLKTGTIYPALARLERAGWLASWWEQGDPRSLARPRRRLYQLTGLGENRARDAVNAHLAQLRAARLPASRSEPRIRLG